MILVGQLYWTSPVLTCKNVINDSKADYYYYYYYINRKQMGCKYVLYQNGTGNAVSSYRNLIFKRQSCLGISRPPAWKKNLAVIIEV